MHQLTIDHHHQTPYVSAYPSFDAAHRALLRYVVDADYYLRPVPISGVHSRYQLLGPVDPAGSKRTRDPRVTGVATIAEIPDTRVPRPAAGFAARDAQRWISDHTATWLHGCATDPGYHYPMAVLTLARGEARRYLYAGTLLPEAAHLAGLDEPAHLDRSIVDMLRHNAIQDDGAHRSPVALAAAVTRLLPADTDDDHTAALIWYYALLRWGASAP